MLRAVLDVGVLVAALLSREGAPALVLDRWRDGDFDLVVSPALLGELDRVLARPKFRAYLAEDEADAYVAALARQAVVVDDPPAEAGLTPDPGDDYLVALARAAAADVLVSGDGHLTSLLDPTPPVLTPRAFLEQLG